MTSNGDKGIESAGHDGKDSVASNGDTKMDEAMTNGANGVSEGDDAVKKNRLEDHGDDDDEEDNGDDDDEEDNEDDDDEEDNDGDGDEEEEDPVEATNSKGKGKGKEKVIEKRPRKRARRNDEDNLDRFEAISKDELSALSGNDIIPRARRSAAIASQRRTASEIGKFVGRGQYDDDDSDEDGQLGGSFATPSAGLGDGESDDEAELEF